tara:strand:+ start:759 stop:935 length:177 start_codon:yes stop_codon:yes gene_type:complete
MGSKTTLLHTIKVNRQMRKQIEFSNKCTHPALLDDWDSLTRDEQSNLLFKWKILIKRN